ncbi:MAG: hypothetical protein K6G10_01525 [Butyrivibrio sp.]|nr:hypothetical protein [Butyrivibrio sp.]
MLYRNRNLNLDKKLLYAYLIKVHAPVDKAFIDCAIHREFGVDVTSDDAIENFTDVEIEEAVKKCAKEDILAVQMRRAKG